MDTKPVLSAKVREKSKIYLGVHLILIACLSLIYHYTRPMTSVCT